MTENEMRAMDLMRQELNQARNRDGTKEGLMDCLRRLGVDYATKNGHSITFDVRFGDWSTETVSATVLEPFTN